MASPKIRSINTPIPGDLTGSKIGRYSVLRRLGAGGMGEVYLAEDTTLKRSVALKRVHPRLRADWQHVQRLLKEAERISAFSHPRIASIYDVLTDQGEVILVMEYIQGTSLRERLQLPMDASELLSLATSCCEALQAAHEKQIVHGDIKPENIMLTAGGSIKLLDFGVARRLSLSHETVDNISQIDSDYLGGTPSYMAPEVLLNQEPDARSDLFSLGIVMYEALAGHHPFPADSVLQRTDKIVHETPPALSKFNNKLPPGLEPIIFKLLAKDPAGRFANASEVLNELQQVQSGRGRSTAIRAKLAQALHKRNHPVLFTAVLLALIVLSAPVLIKEHFKDSNTNVSAAVPQEKFIAVLPFRVIGPTENQAFADGITATLTAKLTQLTAGNSLQVASAEEVHRDSINDAALARKRLGVNLVLQGNLHRSGNNVRISTMLVDAESQRQLRAETITADLSDTFAMEDRVVEAANRMLELESPVRHTDPAVAHGTANNSAYEQYLRGIGFLQNSNDAGSVDSAIQAFNKALAIDANYAPAHAALGEAFWRKHELTKQREFVDAARRSCDRAMQINPRLAAAHLCLGTVLDGTGQYKPAVAAFEKAAAIEPTNDDAYRGLGQAYLNLGSFPDAERTFKRAIEVRPQYWAGHSWLGVLYADAGRYSEAADEFQRAIKLAPENNRPYHQLGGAYIFMGRYDEAIATLQKGISLEPSFPAYSNLGSAYLGLRRFDDAVSSFEQASRLGVMDYVVTGNLGRAYYWTPGKREQAKPIYERAIRLGEDALKVNPKDAAAHMLLANFYAMTGDRKSALQYLENATKLQPKDPELPFIAAIVHNQFGERDVALQQLEVAATRGFSRAEIKNAVELDDLHKGKRFQQLTGTEKK